MNNFDKKKKHHLQEGGGFLDRFKMFGKASYCDRMEEKKNAVKQLKDRFEAEKNVLLVDFEKKIEQMELQAAKVNKENLEKQENMKAQNQGSNGIRSIFGNKPSLLSGLKTGFKNLTNRNNSQGANVSTEMAPAESTPTNAPATNAPATNAPATNAPDTDDPSKKNKLFKYK